MPQVPGEVRTPPEDGFPIFRGGLGFGSPAPSQSPLRTRASRMGRPFGLERRSFLARKQGLDGFGEPVLKEFGALGGDATQVGWRGRGGQHQGQSNHREAQSRNSG